MSSVLIVASIRRDDELNWVKGILEARVGDRIWLVVDKKSAEILAKSNVLSRAGKINLVVFAGRKPEEFTLRIYKNTIPDIVYVCDKYSALKVLVDFLEVAPVRVVKC